MPHTDSSSHPPLRALARLVMAPDWLGAPLACLSGPNSYLAIQRQDIVERRFQARRVRYFAALTVQAGPFAGLRYHIDQSHGSALDPKLLGTYESELHPALDRFRTQTYDDLVDIGFAEGYYLVGLSQWFPRATAWGFDLSADAHRLCHGLAAINGIAPDRLHLAGEATEAALAPALARRALVVCDCEGCEGGLFAAGRIERWKRADLLIECHDFIEPGVTASIRERLAPTHDIELIGTLDNQLKVSQLPPSIDPGFSADERLRLVNEGRPTAQTWIVAVARAH